MPRRLLTFVLKKLPSRDLTPALLQCGPQWVGAVPMGPPAVLGCAMLVGQIGIAMHGNAWWALRAPTLGRPYPPCCHAIMAGRCGALMASGPVIPQATRGRPRGGARHAPPCPAMPAPSVGAPTMRRHAPPRPAMAGYGRAWPRMAGTGGRHAGRPVRGVRHGAAILSYCNAAVSRARLLNSTTRSGRFCHSASSSGRQRAR